MLRTLVIAIGTFPYALRAVAPPWSLDQDIDILKQSDKWVIWKSKNNWSVSLTETGFHQLLHINKDTQEKCWGSKIKGWWRTGDIRV